MKNILVLHGPNLNLLGEREPEVYGTMTLADLNQKIEQFGGELHLKVKCFQSNHEGSLLDYLHENRKWADGVVINPAALTHYSYALRDAISAIDVPTVEVHLSDIEKREAFRKHSVIKDVAIKQFKGLGAQSYLRALEYLLGYEAVGQVKGLLASDKERDVILQDTVRLLKERFPKYSWVGIYLLEGDELVLHNYLGKPSPHTRIEIGRGICGAAASERETIIVPDVNEDNRYLACSIETKSEIVVPILSGQKVFGEIDIDSDMRDAFHEGDRDILEQIAVLLSKTWVEAEAQNDQASMSD